MEIALGVSLFSFKYEEELKILKCDPNDFLVALFRCKSS